MTLITHIPPPPLSHYIEMFWYWADFHPPHPRERILPGGAMELLFHLSDEPLRITYPDDQIHSFRAPIIAGNRSEHFLVETLHPVTILAVWFKPGGGLPFFGASAGDMHNLHVPLDLLWQQAAHDLYEQVHAARTPAECFRLLETALCARLTHTADHHRAVTYALSALTHGQTVAQTIDQIGISARRFIQVFHEQVGLTPKLYARVHRFQRALRLITCGDPTASWVDIALAAGYYDQAHFIHDFQALAGITPTEYHPQSKEHRSNLAVLD